MTTEVTLHLMALPTGFDVLLGMDWLQENDIWINPKRKQLLRSGGKETSELHVCLTDARHAELPGATPIKTGESRPYGIYSVSTDSDNQNEVQVVKHKDFTRLKT